MQFLLKTIITALLVAGISECGKRFSFIGGILASLPLTSVLAFVWLFHETKDPGKIIDLSYIIFWMVIPSLFFFICLPFLLKLGWKFYPALGVSALLMAVVYSGYVVVMKKLGVNL